MKVRKLISIISVATLTLMLSASSCNKNPDDGDPATTPIASFTWIGNETPAPVEVQFINSSLNANLYEWEFGDGGVSTEKDPVHTYFNTSGETKDFIVVLKAIDNSTGLFQRRSKLIQILPSK